MEGQLQLLNALLLLAQAWLALARAPHPLGQHALAAELNETFGLQPPLSLRQVLELLEMLRVLGLAERTDARSSAYSLLIKKNHYPLLKFNLNPESDLFFLINSPTPAPAEDAPLPCPPDPPEAPPAAPAPLPPPAPVEDVLAALQAAGVLPGVRRTLLQADPSLTAERVHLWERYLRRVNPTRYTPGLLVWHLRQGDPYPPEDDPAHRRYPAFDNAPEDEDA